MTLSPADELFAAIARDLFDRFFSSPNLLDKMYDALVAGVAGSSADELRELEHWLNLAETLHRADDHTVHEALSAWLGRGGDEPPDSPKTLVQKWRSTLTRSELCEKERVCRYLPAGLQFMLLAYHPGPQVFRGIAGWTNLLPKESQAQVIRTIRVPLGHGTVSRMLSELTKERLARDRFSVSYCEDAASDLVGRVASQDYVCGNRSVIGFPVFPTLPPEEGFEGLAGFFFLTHPLPRVLKPLRGPATRLRRNYGHFLAQLCRDSILHEFSKDLGAYGAEDRQLWTQLTLPETDPAGFLAIGSRETDGRPLFGLSESAVAQSLTVTLTQITSVSEWSGGWAESVAASLGRNEGMVPSAYESWTRAEVRAPRPLKERLKHLVDLLGANRGSGAEELVFPLAVDGKVESLLCFNLDRSVGIDEGTLRGVEEQWAATCSILSDIRGFLGKLANRSTSSPATFKRAADAWYMVASWLVDYCAQMLDRTPEKRTAPAADGTALTMEHVLRGLANRTDEVVQPFSAMAALSESLGVLLGALSPALSTCAVVSLWSMSWLPRIDRLDGDEEKICSLLRESPDEIRKRAYERLFPRAKRLRTSAEDHTAVLWHGGSSDSFQLLTAAAVPGRLSERVRESMRLLDKSDEILKSALLPAREHLRWTPDSGFADGSPALRYLASENDAALPFRALALGQLQMRARERSEVALRAEVRSARAAAATVSHEIAQITAFLVPETACKQERIFWAARRYLDIWARPKGDSDGLHALMASQFSEKGGAVSYLTAVFNAAADAAALHLAWAELRKAPGANPTRNVAAYERQRGHIRLVFSAASGCLGLAPQLDEPSEVFANRSVVSILSQALAASIHNAICHCAPHQEDGEWFFALYVEIARRSVFICNRYEGEGGDGEREGTAAVLDNCCDYLSRSNYKTQRHFAPAGEALARRASAAYSTVKSGGWWATGLEFSDPAVSPFVEMP